MKSKKLDEIKKIEIDWVPDKNSRHPIYQQIINYICSRISSGDWVVGSKLPSQRKLADLFKVNRSTIVTAMEELQSYGILKSDAGGGTTISSNTWSLLMSTAPPDWGSYIKSGTFKANVPTIQMINNLEFEQGMIRLGTGELAPSLFPDSMMQTIFQKLPKRISSLNYLEPLGLIELRQAISERLSKQGIDATPSSILITSGSLQALQLISVCMLKPGSTIYTETPSYIKSLQLFQSAGMKLVGLPMDREGINYWEIAAMKQCQESSLLYTIPSFHNPTGSVMSQERRRELYRYCSNHMLPIIEDSAYSELWFDEEPPGALKTMDKNGVILYLGTVSKTLAPGLRIGWLVGPESVVERLGDVKMQVDYGSSSISQWAVTEFFSSGLYDKHLISVRHKLKKRRDIALTALDRYFSDIGVWSVPSGSFYIWLNIKGNISTDLLFYEALKEKLLINPGSLYDFSRNRSIRLSYAYADEVDLDNGIKRFCEVIRRLIK